MTPLRRGGCEYQNIGADSLRRSPLNRVGVLLTVVDAFVSVEFAAAVANGERADDGGKRGACDLVGRAPVLVVGGGAGCLRRRSDVADGDAGADAVGRADLERGSAADLDESGSARQSLRPTCALGHPGAPSGATDRTDEDPVGARIPLLSTSIAQTAVAARGRQCPGRQREGAADLDLGADGRGHGQVGRGGEVCVHEHVGNAADRAVDRGRATGVDVQGRGARSVTE